MNQYVKNEEYVGENERLISCYINKTSSKKTLQIKVPKTTFGLYKSEQIFDENEKSKVQMRKEFDEE